MKNILKILFNKGDDTIHDTINKIIMVIIFCAITVLFLLIYNLNN